MLHMILQLLDEVRARHTLVFILQYDGCLDYHTADWVWHTGDGALYYGLGESSGHSLPRKDRCGNPNS